MSSRFLNPTTPGALLTSIAGALSANEELVIQSITNGQYFIFNETPGGTMNGSNQTFTLAKTPKPVASLQLSYNGQLQKAGGVDFSLSGNTITFIAIKPVSTDEILANYTVSPV